MNLAEYLAFVGREIHDPIRDHDIHACIVHRKCLHVAVTDVHDLRKAGKLSSGKRTLPHSGRHVHADGLTLMSYPMRAQQQVHAGATSMIEDCLPKPYPATGPAAVGNLQGITNPSESGGTKVG